MMMQFMDTHIHLQDFSAKDTPDIMKSAENRGVNHFICIGTKEDNWDTVLEIARNNPEKVTPAIAVHPAYIEMQLPGWELRLEQKLLENPGLLIGECGFDRRDKMPEREIQEQAFAVQISLAKKYKRPLLIHAVKAVEWLQNYWQKLPKKFVFHAFNGRPELLRDVLKYGGYAAFGFGILQNRDKEEILRSVPIERMLLETDSPYIPRIRGEENRPEYLPDIASEIATIRGERLEEMAEKIYENSLRLIGKI